MMHDIFNAVFGIFVTHWDNGMSYQPDTDFGCHILHRSRQTNTYERVGGIFF